MNKFDYKIRFKIYGRSHLAQQMDDHGSHATLELKEFKIVKNKQRTGCLKTNSTSLFSVNLLKNLNKVLNLIKANV